MSGKSLSRAVVAGEPKRGGNNELQKETQGGKKKIKSRKGKIESIKRTQKAGGRQKDKKKGSQRGTLARKKN